MKDKLLEEKIKLENLRATYSAASLSYALLTKRILQIEKELKKH
ncbi:MAG: hypothetical protein ACRCX8_08510 [Sarcina sp.]